MFLVDLTVFNSKRDSVINFKKTFLVITLISLILGSALQAMKQRTITDEDLAQAISDLKLMQAKDVTIRAKDMTPEELSRQLVIASSKGDIEEIEVLLEQGAKINSATNIGGQLSSPLFAAIFAQNLATVIYLVVQGAFIDMRLSSSPSAQDPLYLTPVHYAAMLGYEDIFSTLIMYGKTSTGIPAINLRDNLGNTPLHYTARQGIEANTSLLLEKGSDPNARNHSGYTPIFDAAFNGNVHIIQLLLKAGASHYLSDAKGIIHSALAAACSNGQVGAVDLLLEKCEFTLTDIKESLGRLDSFHRHLCCTSKPKEDKCAKCLENEEKINHISDKLENLLFLMNFKI